MSLDLFLRPEPCKTCSHLQDSIDFNCTYNLSPMWYKIYPDAECMVDIDGMTGEQAYEKLSHARNELERHPHEFIALNPKNGWGDYDGFLDFINGCIKASLENPALIWSSSR